MEKDLAYDREVFRRLFIDYLKERFPELRYRKKMVRAKALSAEKEYNGIIALTKDNRKALKAAEGVLYEGFLFSRFSMVLDIVTTQLPLMRTEQHRKIAREITVLCHEKFKNYNIHDAFESTEEFDELKIEITEFVAAFIDQQ